MVRAQQARVASSGRCIQVHTYGGENPQGGQLRDASMQEASNGPNREAAEQKHPDEADVEHCLQEDGLEVLEPASRARDD